jgi:hypothetical protein
MIDQTKLTMGLTVEELEKLEALERNIHSCGALPTVPEKTDNTPTQDLERQDPDSLALIYVG